MIKLRSFLDLMNFIIILCLFSFRGRYLLKSGTWQVKFFTFPSFILIFKNEGVTLKSLVERNYEHLPESCLEFIKSSLFEAFEDSNTAIRNAVGTLVTTIIYKGGFQKWPNLLVFLSSKLESSELGAVFNAIECLAKIVEDLRVNSENYSYLDSSKGGS